MENCNDEVLILIASFLHSHDLVQLGRSCKRFGKRPSSSDDRKPPAKKRKTAKSKRKRTEPPDEHGNTTYARTISLVDEVARQRVAKAIQQHEDWKDILKLRGKQSWISVDHRLQMLHSSLVFYRIIGNGLSYVGTDLSHIKAKERPGAIPQIHDDHQIPPPVTCATALCQEVMRTGKHFATFTITSPGQDVKVGVMRPVRGFSPKKKQLFDPSINPPEFHHPNFVGQPPWIFNDSYEDFCSGQGEGYEGNLHCCFYALREGLCATDTYVEQWSPFSFEHKKNDKIGLLLDLDRGELAVYKNRRYLGVMKTGLSGYFSWAVVIRGNETLKRNKQCWDEASIRVKRAPVPRNHERDREIIPINDEIHGEDEGNGAPVQVPPPFGLPVEEGEMFFEIPDVPNRFVLPEGGDPVNILGQGNQFRRGR